MRDSYDAPLRGLLDSLPRQIALDLRCEALVQRQSLRRDLLQGFGLRGSIVQVVSVVVADDRSTPRTPSPKHSVPIQREPAIPPGVQMLVISEDGRLFLPALGGGG